MVVVLIQFSKTGNALDYFVLAKQGKQVEESPLPALMWSKTEDCGQKL